jgi:hypothetical protein
MKKNAYSAAILCCFLLPGIRVASAQNPLILDQFTADPSARVFDGRVYVYPSHDLLAGEGRGRAGWFCMADYHVFSSEDLARWTDHGVIVSQNAVPWADSTAYSMWAPDCIRRNGRYYFYFPAMGKNKGAGMGFGMGVGVAVSDSPAGPFRPEPEPIAGVSGIDPNPFIDRDGQAYLYWGGMRGLFVAKLKDSMLELASEPRPIKDLPEGMKEGPYLFERNGVYYFTFPHVSKKTEELAYATGDNPMGPFTYRGVIMDESPTGCWTNHHSIIEYRGQWYLFYHHNDLSPNFDKNRSIRADSLFFNEDGTVRKVIPTFRGVGVTDASRKIQIDRYSAKSAEGASIAFVDTLRKQEGWKAILKTKDAWIRYNSVDFGSRDRTALSMMAASEKGGAVAIRIDSTDGPLVGRIDVPFGADWSLLRSSVSRIPTGVHHLVVMSVGENPVEIDWLSFE